MKITSPITRIITHASCADGIISAAILHRVFPEASVEPVQYGTPARENLDITEGMVFVDMSPPLHLVDEAVAKGAYILDHHKGAKETVLKFGERGVFADEKEQPGVSGAVLAYRHVYRRTYDATFTLDNFVRLIGVYDTWQTTDEEWNHSRELSAAVRFFGQDYFLENPVAFSPELWVVGERLLEQNRGHVFQACANMVGFKKKAINFGIYPDPHRVSSEVGEECTRVRGTYDVTAGFNYGQSTGTEVALNFSLRSNDNFDVSALAKKYGGSGHTHAAGFTYMVDAMFAPNPYSMFRELVRQFFEVT